MSKRRDELERAASHHIEIAKCWQSMGENHGALAKLGGDAADCHAQMASACNKAMENHASEATACMAAMKAMDAGADDPLDKIQPDKISSVYATDFVKAIPRHGAPQIPDIERVPQAFKHLVQLNED